MSLQYSRLPCLCVSAVNQTTVLSGTFSLCHQTNFAVKKTNRSDFDEFIASPDSEKQRIVQEIEAETPQQRLKRSRPLNTREKRQWREFKAKMGRPKVGKGAKTISLTVERELLKLADAYAKRHGISRARLVAKGLHAILDSAA
jgi:hypothetical protein